MVNPWTRHTSSGASQYHDTAVDAVFVAAPIASRCFLRSQTSTGNQMQCTCAKQERLHAENLERAKARRTREEAEARDRAAAAAAAADLAKEEAVGCLQRLQKQHSEQVRRA